MQLAFWQKKKSSLFFLLLSVLLAKSPLDDISIHEAIPGLSRHGALTVPGSNPPPTPLISSSEALVRNINVSILSWPNAPNRSRITTALRGWGETIIGRKCLFPSLISSSVSNQEPKGIDSLKSIFWSPLKPEQHIFTSLILQEISTKLRVRTVHNQQTAGLKDASNRPS